MSKVRFELNRNGVKELLKSDGIKGCLTEHAMQVRNRAGEGYSVEAPYMGRNRANVAVYAETYEARKDNSEHNTLLKALR